MPANWLANHPETGAGTATRPLARKGRTMTTDELRKLVNEQIARHGGNADRVAKLRRFEVDGPRGHYFACDADRDDMAALRASRSAEQMEAEKYAGWSHQLGDPVETPVADAAAKLYDEVIYNLACRREER